MAQILARKLESKPLTETQPFDWRAHLKVHPAAELLPAISDDELRALADDIWANGLRTKIVVWCPDANTQNEALLDGRHRLDALARLGLLCINDAGSLALTKTWGGNKWLDGPGRLECDYSLGSDPYALALSYNVHRRHVTLEQKRDLIAKVLKAKPGQSNRVIAEQVKADHKTIETVRAGMEGRGEIPHVEKHTDSKGRSQPAKKAKPVAEQTAVKDSDSAKTVSVRDTALIDFTAHVLELRRRVGKHRPERFINSAITPEDLVHLSKFLAALAELKTQQKPKGGHVS